MISLIRNYLLISCTLAVGFLLGAYSNGKLIAPLTYDDHIDGSPFPTQSHLIDESKRTLLEVLFNENEEEYGLFGTPIMGDDGILYDDDMLNLEDILSSLEAFTNHSNDAEFLEMESLTMDEEITEVATDEEKEEPEALLSEIESVEPLDYERKLKTHDFHMPLACNEKIENQACTTSFRSLIEESNENEALVIPCGECVLVDYDDGSEVTLANGLSIEGKLYFPTTASVILRTKFVWVAGILEVSFVSVDEVSLWCFVFTNLTHPLHIPD